MKRKRSRLYSFILAWFMLLACIPTQAAAANLPPGTSKAVVFLLDASNSMNTNDRERLAKDSIAQLIYSLPSNYYVGFAAYNTSVVSSVGMQDSGDREPVMDAVDTVTYIGYTNAGAGLTTAMELLDTVSASEKTVVILSDGEIIMNSDDATAESSRQFQAAVEAARTQGVRIHVIGLGADMADEDNTIFSASAQTNGVNYHAPQSADIQAVIDSILQEQLGVKKTRAAIVDTDGGTEDITVNIPSINTSRTRVLLTSENPIQNLKADFSAVNGWQYSGSRYTLLELDHPTDTAVHITFQGRAGGQIKVDVISEYVLVTQLQVSYTDSNPTEPEAEYPDRMADITAAFYDAGDSDRQMLTDPVFQGMLIPVMVDGDVTPCYLKDGAVTFQRTVPAGVKASIQFDFTRLDTNLILEQPISMELEGPAALPKPPLEDYRPQIIVGSLILLALISMLIIWLASRRKRAKVVPQPPATTAAGGAATAPTARTEETSRYGYVGRLNIYITNTLSGHDFPPLTYNLFRIPGGKKLSLQEILESCEVDEPFEGADKIFFQPAAGHCLLLTNESDCTLMQNREILMKGHSYVYILTQQYIDKGYSEKKAKKLAKKNHKDEIRTAANAIVEENRRGSVWKDGSQFPDRTLNAQMEAQYVAAVMNRLEYYGKIEPKMYGAVTVLTHSDGSVSVGFSTEHLEAYAENTNVAYVLHKELIRLNNERHAQGVNYSKEYAVSGIGMPLNRLDNCPGAALQLNRCAEPKAMETAHSNKYAITGGDTVWRGGPNEKGEIPHSTDEFRDPRLIYVYAQMEPCTQCQHNVTNYYEYATES